MLISLSHLNDEELLFVKRIIEEPQLDRKEETNKLGRDKQIYQAKLLFLQGSAVRQVLQMYHNEKSVLQKLL